MRRNNQMNIEILPMEEKDMPKFKKDIQEAFQLGFEDVYGKTDGTILPEKDIDRSLNAKGSVAYKAVAHKQKELVLKSGKLLKSSIQTQWYGKLVLLILIHAILILM